MAAAHSIRHPRPSTVIPAKAGIHTPAYRYAGDIPGFWIPACAGMTVGAHGMIAEGRALAQATKKPSPSGRGLGEGETLCAIQPHMKAANPTVIPAQAGIQNPGRRGRVRMAKYGFPLSRE